MKIETKFNIGDEVWFILNNKVNCSKISKIAVEFTNKDNYYYYHFEYDPPRSPTLCNYFSIKNVFATKQELLDSL